MTTDTRSAVTLGHRRLPVSDLEGAIGFFEAIGGRRDTRRDGFAVVELRDRTRIQLTRSDATLPAGSAPQFDFRVEDIDAAWAEYSAKGLDPSDITRRNPGHDWFVLNGPDGIEIRINSGFRKG
jgi:hypothetical protein